MRAGSACVRNVIIAFAVAFPLAAHAEPGEKFTFAVTRNDAQIGTNTITLGHAGPQTSVESVTHVSVGLAFITLYKFDQTESEQWSNGRLVALSTVTNDNGTLHHTVADSRGAKLIVNSDGTVNEIAATVLPANPWNPQILQQAVALDPEYGALVPVSIVDRGEENVVVAGRSERAHHYVIKTTFSRDVWYDGNHALVRMEMKGSDGSTIRYVLS